MAGKQCLHQRCVNFLITTVAVLSLSTPSLGQHVPGYFETFSQASSILSAVQEKGADAVQSHIEEHFPDLLSPVLFQQKLMEKINSLTSDKLSIQSLSSLEVSEACSNHTGEILFSIVERQKWALTALDAMGKPGPDLQGINLNWPGAYDECLSIPVTQTNQSLGNTSDHAPFPLQYCSATWDVTVSPLGLPVSLSLGLCMPKSCNTTELKILVYTVLSELGIQNPYLERSMCQDPDKPLDSYGVAGIVVCSVFVALMLIGTAVDVLHKHWLTWRMQKMEIITNYGPDDVLGETRPLLLGDQGPLKTPEPGIVAKVLICFSVYTNGAKLLSTKQSAGTLSCVHGIRFLSMTWVVLGHTFLMPFGFSSNFWGYFTQAFKRWTFQAISNATVSVDTFFVLSGLLVSYLSLREMKRKAGKLNFFMFYFHRFWRLTPPYMLIIVVYMCLGRYWGSGPLWMDEQLDRDDCKTSWWTNMLYINNFVDVDKICLGQSWYLANDMQFYVLSPLIFIPLYYSPLMGFVSALFFLVATTVTPAGLTMRDHLSLNGPNYQKEYYIKPYCRMGPYIVGMLTGYLLYRTDCRLRINRKLNLLCWAVATASALAVLYGLYETSQGHPLTLPVTALYNAVNRTVWGACVAWVIFACVTGNGGFVNTILSWKAFIPLSRLTYCIYLLHIMMLYAYILTRDTLFYYSDANVVVLFLAVLVACYMVSAVVSLAFEAPMMALEKVIFHRDSR